MTSVITYSRTQSVTYVADNILKSLKDLVRLSGLDPSKLVDSSESNSKALNTWLESEDLIAIVLEIYNPETDNLITSWEFKVSYGWSDGNGSFWTDTEQLRYHILKAGVVPSEAKYDLLLRTKKGRPDVHGWGSGSSRSKNGMIRQSLGSTVEHNGLGASASYWRKK